MKTELLIKIFFIISENPQGVTLSTVHKLLMNEPGYANRLEQYKNPTDKLVPLKRALKSLYDSSPSLFTKKNQNGETLYLSEMQLVRTSVLDIDEQPSNSEIFELTQIILDELVVQGIITDGVRIRAPYVFDEQEQLLIELILAVRDKCNLSVELDSGSLISVRPTKVSTKSCRIMFDYEYNFHSFSSPLSSIKAIYRDARNVNQSCITNPVNKI